VNNSNDLENPNQNMCLAEEGNI